MITIEKLRELREYLEKEKSKIYLDYEEVYCSDINYECKNCEYNDCTQINNERLSAINEIINVIDGITLI